jgi:hypothetical protein
LRALTHLRKNVKSRKGDGVGLVEEILSLSQDRSWSLLSGYRDSLPRGKRRTRLKALR